MGTAVCSCVDDSVCACVGTVVCPIVGASMCVAVHVCGQITVCVYTIVVVHASVCVVGANLATSVLNFSLNATFLCVSLSLLLYCVIDYII